MSKSRGNFFLVREVLKKFPPLVIRFFLLSTHYRSPLDFDDEKIIAAGRGWERLKNSIRLVSDALNRQLRLETCDQDQERLAKLENIRTQSEEALDDDFNTALAISFCFELAKEANTYLQEEAIPCKDILQKILALFMNFNEILGLFKTDSQAKIFLGDQPKKGDELVQSLIELFLQFRQEAREKKDWATADRIRDGLKEQGILIEDTPYGTRWKIDRQE
jgi:cysteinyl-tRNA synthetase